MGGHDSPSAHRRFFDNSPRAGTLKSLRCMAGVVCSLFVVALGAMALLNRLLLLPLELDAPASSAGLSSYGPRSQPVEAQRSREVQRAHELTEKYTVRMNTFRRNDLLKKTVEHYHTCPRVHEIQIVWSDLANEPPPRSFFKLPRDSSAKDTAASSK